MYQNKLDDFFRSRLREKHFDPDEKIIAEGVALLLPKKKKKYLLWWTLAAAVITIAAVRAFYVMGSAPNVPEMAALDVELKALSHETVQSQEISANDDIVSDEALKAPEKITSIIDSPNRSLSILNAQISDVNQPSHKHPDISFIESSDQSMSADDDHGKLLRVGLPENTSIVTSSEDEIVKINQLTDSRLMHTSLALLPILSIQLLKEQKDFYKLNLKALPRVSIVEDKTSNAFKSLGFYTIAGGNIDLESNAGWHAGLGVFINVSHRIRLHYNGLYLKSSIAGNAVEERTFLDVQGGQLTPTVSVITEAENIAWFSSRLGITYNVNRFDLGIGLRVDRLLHINGKETSFDASRGLNIANLPSTPPQSVDYMSRNTLIKTEAIEKWQALPHVFIHYRLASRLTVGAGMHYRLTPFLMTDNASTEFANASPVQLEIQLRYRLW